MNPKREPPPRSPTKVAFLFLTRDNHERPELWKRYFQGIAESDYAIFTHAKNPELVTQPFLSDNLIAQSIPTEWGSISLVQATLLLLKAALEDGDITHFILLSETCVPTKPLHLLRELLAQDPRSWITDTHPHSFADADFPKSTRFIKAPHIPLGCQAFQNQWMLLSREVAQFFADHDLTNLFAEMFAPDEAYFITILKLAGFPPDKLVDERITWSKWNPDLGHPELHEALGGELLSEIIRAPGFFARKFTSAETQPSPALLDAHHCQTQRDIRNASEAR